MLTINALVAADSVLLPVEAQVLSYDDISETLATVNGVRKKFNPQLKIEGILLTKYQGQTKLGRSIMKLIQDNYSAEIALFTHPIPYAVKLAEQPAYGISIHELDPSSKASLAYELVVKELLVNG
jgi:chromosome partitioning protein